MDRQDGAAGGLYAGIKGRGLAAARLTHPRHLREDAVHLRGLDRGGDVKLRRLGREQLCHVRHAGRIDAVGRGLDLIRARRDRAHRACIRHRQGIRTANAEADVFCLRHILEDGPHEAAECIRQEASRCVADRDAGRAGSNGRGERLVQKGRIGTRRIVRQKLHVFTDGLRRRDGLADSLEHGSRLFARQIFHLHGADRSRDLDARVLRFLQGVPYRLHALLCQRDWDGYGARLHRGRHRFDEQAVDLRIFHRVQLDGAHAEPVKELGQLDLLSEAQGIAGGLARLPDGHVGDVHVFQRRFLLFSENKKSLKPIGFRDEVSSRYHPAYPPPHGERPLSDSDKSTACNAARRTLLLTRGVHNACSGIRLPPAHRYRLAPAAGSLKRALQRQISVIAVHGFWLPPLYARSFVFVKRLLTLPVQFLPHHQKSASFTRRDCTKCRWRRRAARPCRPAAAYARPAP